MRENNLQSDTDVTEVNIDSLFDELDDIEDDELVSNTNSSNQAKEVSIDSLLDSELFEDELDNEFDDTDYSELLSADTEDYVDISNKETIDINSENEETDEDSPIEELIDFVQSNDNVQEAQSSLPQDTNVVFDEDSTVQDIDSLSDTLQQQVEVELKPQAELEVDEQVLVVKREEETKKETKEEKTTMDKTEYIPAEITSPEEIKLIEDLDAKIADTVSIDSGDYMNTYARSVIRAYKSGKITKRQAEAIAYRNRLVEMGSIKSYNLDTPNNYNGTIPSPKPPMLEDHGYIGITKTGNTVIFDLDSIDTMNVIKVEDRSMIRVTGVKTSGLIQDLLKESPDSITTYADDVFKSIIFSIKRQCKDISRIDICNGQMIVNKKLVMLNGIIDNDSINRDALSLQSIVNFNLIVQFCPDIETLFLGEDILEILYLQYGDDCIAELFNKATKLQVIMIQEISGKLSKVTKEMVEKKAKSIQHEIILVQDRIRLRDASVSKLKNNFDNRSLTDRIMNVKRSTAYKDSQTVINSRGSLAGLIGKVIGGVKK